ncbi:MAG: VWA domain-containing protein, partial [Candidatus Aminicenantes bacterium]|nr:VWA domain-containing protein [Candidatus Aminicenantes bacterium]
MTKKKIFFLFLFLTLYLQPSLQVLSSGLIQAQIDQQELKHEVSVVLKLVQVYVTDKNGNPVTDLEKSDFILYENGQLKTITAFEKHFLIKPEKKTSEEIVETKLPPALKIPSRMNRKLFLFLDVDRIDLKGFSKSKKMALNFIDTQLQPTDEVGVFSFSFMQGLVVHEYLTQDHKKVREAMNKIKGIPGAASLSAGSGGTIYSSSGGSSINYLSPPITEQDDIVTKTNNFIKVIKDLAEALRYIPGYKNIILFSSGIQSSLLFSSDQVLRETYEEMSKELASSDSPVYSVNSSGGGRSASLEMLSELSGGKYFHNVGNYDEISEQIQDITSNYYVLGYYIGEQSDGKYQEIEVKVNRKGCEVHAQSGYYNPKPFVQLSEFEKQLHLVDLAYSEKPYSQNPLNFPCIALPCFHNNESNIVLLSKIDGEEMGEVTSGNVEILTLIIDKTDNIVDSSRGEVSFSSDTQKNFFYYSIVPMSPGLYECRVVIRNVKTGKAAVATSSVEISEPKESGIRLDLPLLLVPEKKSSYIKASKPQEKNSKEESFSIKDFYPFLSNDFS